MSQQNWNTPPPRQFQQRPDGQQQWGGPPQAPRQNNTIWWVLIGIAVVALAGILLYALLGGGDGPAAPTQPQSTSPQETGGQQGAKDLSSPSFPDSLGGLQKTSEESFPGDGILTNYEGDGLVLSASVAFDNSAYDDIIANDLTDRERIGNADCGYSEYVTGGDEDLPPIPTCAVNGSDGYLSVSLDPVETTRDMSLADLARFTEELHSAL